LVGPSLRTIDSVRIGPMMATPGRCRVPSFEGPPWTASASTTLPGSWRKQQRAGHSGALPLPWPQAGVLLGSVTMLVPRRTVHSLPVRAMWLLLVAWPTPARPLVAMVYASISFSMSRTAVPAALPAQQGRFAVLGFVVITLRTIAAMTPAA
jgi:hypothetical protein